MTHNVEKDALPEDVEQALWTLVGASRNSDYRNEWMAAATVEAWLLSNVTPPAEKDSPDA